MIEYQVDEQMLEEVQAKLGEMSRKAPMVISRALNKVAVTARVDLANKAQATYTVKSGGFKKDMTIRKASALRWFLPSMNCSRPKGCLSTRRTA